MADGHYMDCHCHYMSLTAPHNTSSEEEKYALIKAALDAGANILNGGEFYGPNAGRANIHIKGGSRPKLNIDNSPEYTPASIASWEMCRRVSQADYLREGLIGGVSLTEVNANTIRQAVKICKIVAVEVEISLFKTEPLTNGVCEACAEFGIPIFAYSSLGRGFLTRKAKTFDDLSPLAKWIPRFQGDNFTANLQPVEEIIPVPGASRMDQVSENLREVELAGADMDEVDAFLARFVTVGARMPEFTERFLDKTDTTEI
ncbi:NADP-dependent oxidoreductase domain-containing protein [Biscogniauxia mediterranea]|nr:NADP-dependent oxidoreductase domain-containing protein [Biscogniauxia mediterranea]